MSRTIFQSPFSISVLEQSELFKSRDVILFSSSLPAIATATMALVGEAMFDTGAPTVGTTAAKVTSYVVGTSACVGTPAEVRPPAGSCT